LTGPPTRLCGVQHRVNEEGIHRHHDADLMIGAHRHRSFRTRLPARACTPEHVHPIPIRPAAELAAHGGASVERFWSGDRFVERWSRSQFSPQGHEGERSESSEGARANSVLSPG
jgi:hypothetical protein